MYDEVVPWRRMEPDPAVLTIPDGAAHEVFHQGDLVAVVLHRRRTLAGDAAGDLRGVLVLRLADHGLLDGLQPPRHAFHRAADDARVGDLVAVDPQGRGH